MDDVESEALATLVVNKLRGGLKICAGGTVISDEIGLQLENT